MNLSEPYVCVTHNDGDALGCMCVLNATKAPEKYFTTNYRNLADILTSVRLYCQKNRINHVLFADVSFSNNRQRLIDFIRAQKKIDSRFTCTVVDHHVYSDTFWKGVNATVFLDSTKSACKILFDELQKDYPIYNLSKMIEALNGYDIFDTTRFEFQEALIFNEFIYAYTGGNTDKMLEIVDMLEESDIPYGYTFVMQKFREDYLNSFRLFKQDAIENGVLIRSTRGVNISILLVPEYFRMFVVTEFERGQDVVLCARGGSIAVRISKDAFSDEAVQNIRYELGCSDTGHLRAFHVELPTDSPEDVVEYLARISKIMNKYSQNAVVIR